MRGVTPEGKAALRALAEELRECDAEEARLDREATAVRGRRHEAIRRAAATPGVSLSDVARVVGLSKQRVHQIVHGD
jgi:hypothetical protein